MSSPTTIGNLSEPDANSAIADYLNDAGRNWHADAELAWRFGNSDKDHIFVDTLSRIVNTVNLTYRDLVK